MSSPGVPAIQEPEGKAIAKSPVRGLRDHIDILKRLPLSPQQLQFVVRVLNEDAARRAQSPADDRDVGVHDGDRLDTCPVGHADRDIVGRLEDEKCGAGDVVEPLSGLTLDDRRGL